MRKIKCFFLLAAMMLAIQMSFAQGYKMVVDGQEFDFGDKDTLSFTLNPSDGSALMLFQQNGRIKVLSGNSITFDGDIESYFQQMLAAPTTLGLNGTEGYGVLYAFGYGAIMHMRDRMTADMYANDTGYDYFYYYRNCLTNKGNDVYPWAFYQTSLNACNVLIKALEQLDELNDKQKYYLSVAYTYRAFLYIDMARMYEFLPCDAIKFVGEEGDYLTNLTVPIITEPLSANEAKYCTKPRATREEMSEFILSDLTKAEKDITLFERANKRLPDLAVVYGLQARLYMWIEDYKNATICAQKAIDLGWNTPLTADEMLDVENGFNSMEPSSWMWGAQPSAEQVSTYLCWPFSMCNEGGLGFYVTLSIPASLYDKIGDKDPRKQLFKSTGNEPIRSGFENDLYSAPKLASLKFRLYGNDGNDYKQYSRAAYPLMRIEEMYLIRAEGVARTRNYVVASAQFRNYIQNYRDPEYVVPTNDGATREDNLIDAIFQQKRIELWGEGQIFFDYKRLNKPVDRTVPGDDWPNDHIHTCTTTRPAWMNIPIASTKGYYADMPFIATTNNPPVDSLYLDGGGFNVREISRPEPPAEEEVNYDYHISSYSNIMQDPDGKAMARFDAYFNANVKQAYFALVDRNMSEEEAFEAWKTGKLEGVYKVKMPTDDKTKTYNYPHFPSAWGIYWPMVFGEMKDGTYKILTPKYPDAYNSNSYRYEYPSSELNLNDIYCIKRGDDYLLHVAYSCNELPTKLQICLVPRDPVTQNPWNDVKNGMIIDLDRDKTEMDIPFTFNHLIYNSYLIGLDDSGKVCAIQQANNLLGFPKKIGDVVYTSGGFEQVESEIYQFAGQNRFFFTNFMGSGLDVAFMVRYWNGEGRFNIDNVHRLCGDFVPLDNCFWDNYGWYLYDDDKEESPVWTPTGWETPIYGFYYWDNYDSYPYSFIDFREGKTSYFYSPVIFKNGDMTEYEYNTVNYTIRFVDE